MALDKVKVMNWAVQVIDKYTLQQGIPPLTDEELKKLLTRAFYRNSRDRGGFAPLAVYKMDETAATIVQSWVDKLQKRRELSKMLGMDLT